MLGDITAADEIYIVTGRTDMRKSIDGRCAIVEDQLHMDPRRSALYLFCGKRCDRIKALLWESDGFVLLYKRKRKIASTLTFCVYIFCAYYTSILMFVQGTIIVDNRKL
ncbi:MAG: IS66 family insertion sequence element accessory protein TnpB [Coprococcus sp.]